jgi:acetyl esterase/lipase
LIRIRLFLVLSFLIVTPLVGFAQVWADPAHWRTVSAPLVTKDLVYFPSDSPGYTPSSQRLDIFQGLNPGHKPSPVLVYMHGGAWRNGAKPEHWEPFRAWLDAGFIIVNVEYRLFDTVPAPAPAALQDVRCALSWVKHHDQEYGFDAQRVVTYGTSAGGHLALLSAVIDTKDYHDIPACTDQPQISAVLDFYGPYHLEPKELGAFVNPAVALWMGADPKPSLLGMEHEMSPSTYIRHAIPPIFLAHGDADQTVPYASSVQAHVDLDAAGVTNELITVPNGSHGRWSAKENDRVQLESLKFLSRLALIRASSSD